MPYLLYGLPNSRLMELQRVQNAAVRVVAASPSFCRVSPLLYSFSIGYLFVTALLKFKILLLTFKCLHGLVPSWTELDARLNVEKRVKRKAHQRKESKDQLTHPFRSYG